MITIKKKQHYVSPYIYAGLDESGVITQLKLAPQKDGIPITKENILEVATSICNKMNETYFTPDDVKKRSRKKEIIEIRHLSAFFMRKLLNESWTAIGRFLGGRDHSTAINSFKQWDNATSLPFEKRVHQINNSMCRSFGIKEMH